MKRISLGRIVLIVFVGLFVVAVGWLLFGNNGSDEQAQENKSQTSYQNFNILTDKGVSDSQVRTTSEQTKKYIEQKYPEAKTVTLVPSSVRHILHPPGSTIELYEYTISVDQSAVYKVNLQVVSIDTVKVLLFDQDGKQVFDSGFLQN